MNEPFKTCSVCWEVWPGRVEFLADPYIRLAGYQPDFGDLSTGLVLFNHDLPHCRTTLAIPVSVFADLYSGPVLETRLTGTDECPRHCFRWRDTSRCPKQCECAYVRELLHRIVHGARQFERHEERYG